MLAEDQHEALRALTCHHPILDSDRTIPVHKKDPGTLYSGGANIRSPPDIGGAIWPSPDRFTRRLCPKSHAICVSPSESIKPLLVCRHFDWTGPGDRSVEVLVSASTTVGEIPANNVRLAPQEIPIWCLLAVRSTGPTGGIYRGSPKTWVGRDSCYCTKSSQLQSLGVSPATKQYGGAMGKNGSTAWSGLGADLRLAALREDNVVGLEVPMDDLCDGENIISYNITLFVESLNATPPET